MSDYTSQVIDYYQRILPFTKRSDIRSIPEHNCFLYDSIFERIDAGEPILRGRTKRFLNYLCFYWQDPVSKDEGSVFLFHTIQIGHILPEEDASNLKKHREPNWSGWNNNFVQDTTKYYRNEEEFLMDFFQNPNIQVDSRIRP